LIVGLLLLDVTVVLRAVSVLNGSVVSRPRSFSSPMPLPRALVEVYMASLDLLGVPVLFLVAGSVASASLIGELVKRVTGIAPGADGPLMHLLRLVQAILPLPLMLGVAIAALGFVVSLVIMLVVLAAVAFGLYLLFSVLLS